MNEPRERTDGWALGALAITVTVAVIAGCAEPPSPEPLATAASALTSLPGSPGAELQVCLVNRYCSFKPATGSDADTSHYPLWQRLGCGAIHSFEDGPLTGLGALCADSADNRALLHNSALSGLVPVTRCVAPPAISPCLNLPTGVIFVDFDPGEPQPYCPSSCRETPSMLPF